MLYSTRHYSITICAGLYLLMAMTGPPHVKFSLISPGTNITSQVNLASNANRNKGKSLLPLFHLDFHNDAQFPDLT